MLIGWTCFSYFLCTLLFHDENEFNQLESLSKKFRNCSFSSSGKALLFEIFSAISFERKNYVIKKSWYLWCCWFFSVELPWLKRFFVGLLLWIERREKIVQKSKKKVGFLCCNDPYFSNSMLADVKNIECWKINGKYWVLEGLWAGSFLRQERGHTTSSRIFDGRFCL